MKPIRVVQFGTWQYTHAAHTMAAMRSLPTAYDVVGVCEPDESRWAQAQTQPCYQGLRRLTVEAVTADRTVDAVMVETHELEQDAAALYFASHGFAVHADKPCGLNAAQFDRLIDTVEQKNLVFQVGYMYRYNPAVRCALDWIRAGRIGDVLCVEAQMNQCYSGAMLDWLATIPGGMMGYLGCHLIDLVYAIQGAPQSITPMHTSTGRSAAPALDNGLALLRYPRGISIVKSCAAEVSGDARRYLMISGTAGTIEIAPIENPVEVPGMVCANRIHCRITTSPYPMAFADRPETVTFPPYGRYDAMLIDFARMVRGEKPNDFPPEYERAVHRAIIQSLGTAGDGAGIGFAENA